MGQGETLLLGFIAGATILIGLPLGRLRSPKPGLRQILNAIAVGILLFLLWDVLAHAFEPIDTALGNLHDDTAGIGPVLGYGSLFFGSIAVGLLSIVYYEKWLDRDRHRRPKSVGAMAATDLDVPSGIAGWSPSRRLALLIAVGIGLHNFGEGLAIGGSAANGEIGLATMLVIGFALHTATEGFGIVAPLAADDDRPSWGFLVLMGAIGGGPTFIGTAVGRQFTSEAVSVVFLALAAGSILYVIIQLLGIAHRGRKDYLYWGVLIGLFAGFLTDMIVTGAGA